jgi:hypothetical protein
MLSSMEPIALSHGDCAKGAGVEDCITSAITFCRVELGSSPMYFPPSSSVSTVVGCLWSDPVGRDLWGGKHAAGGMSEDNDR